MRYIHFCAYQVSQDIKRLQAIDHVEWRSHNIVKGCVSPSTLGLLPVIIMATELQSPGS